MKRLLIAVLSTAVLLVAANHRLFAATALVFPKNSAAAFSVQLPQGWSATDDNKGTLTLSSPGLPVAVSLIVLDNATVAAQMSVAQLANMALQPTNASSIYKQVPGSISGMDGTTYFASSKSGDGTAVDLKLTVLVINARYIVMEIVGTPTVMTPALETSLKSVTKGITLKVAK